MKRLLLLLLSCLFGVASAAAQSPAKATLFARDHAGGIELALRIELDRGWHLYHEHLGPADAVGDPTVVTLQAPGLSFGPLRFPEPKRLVQVGLGDQGRDTYILAHEGTFAIYARAELPAGAASPDLGAIEAKVTGMVCDESTCVPYAEVLRPSAGVASELWAQFPAPLRPVHSAEAGTAAAPREPISEQEEQGAHGRLPPQAEASSWASDSDEVARSALYLRAEEHAFEAAVVIELRPGWHLYHSELGSPEAVGFPTTVQWSGAGVRFGPTSFPEPESLEQFGSTVLVHSGRVVLRARGELDEAASLEDALASVRVALRGQTCDDRLCLDYSAELASSGTGSAADFERASLRPEPIASGQQENDARANTTSASSATAPAVQGELAATPPETRAPRTSWAAFLWQCIGGALFALLMPCTYPMIPITISFFTKQAHARGKSPVGLATLYGMGIVLMFIAIGLVVGPVIVKFAAHPVTNLVIAVVFLLFGLSLLGLFLLQPPAFLMRAASKASTTGGTLGVFLMGATLVVTSFTCTAPIVGAILSLGAEKGDTLRLVAGMSVFGLTMAVPFVALALLPARLQSLPKSGEWMNTLKIALGFVELAAALKFLSNVDLVWGWGLLSRELFLLLWFGILLCAALYLFGFMRLEGHAHEGIGAGRMIAGLATFLFALYCGYGAAGYELDETMTAIAPPYSHARVAAVLPAGADHAPLGPAAAVPSVVVDDYDAALARARATGKGLLVNFTGHTCVNCRLMEKKVFPAPEVAPVLANFVEARLHTDGTANLERILELQARLSGTIANPVYVLVEPATERALGKFEGATRDPAVFARFLESGLP